MGSSSHSRRLSVEIARVGRWERSSWTRTTVSLRLDTTAAILGALLVSLAIALDLIPVWLLGAAMILVSALVTPCMLKLTLSSQQKDTESTEQPFT